MNVIGEKLSNQELLKVKGGGVHYDCACTSGPHNGETWSGTFDNTNAAVTSVTTYCGSQSNGRCVAEDLNED